MPSLLTGEDRLSVCWRGWRPTTLCQPIGRGMESENNLGQSGDCWLLVDVLLLVVVSEWLGRGGEREERGGEEHKIIASLVRLQY